MIELAERVAERSARFRAIEADDLRRRALRAFEADDFAHAVLCMREIVARDPTDSGGWVNLGYALTGALAEGERAGRRDPDRPAQLAEAKAALRRAIRLRPFHGRPLANFAGLVGGLEDRYRAAVRLYRHAARVEPGEVVAHIGLAIILQIVGDPDGAEAAWRRALAHEPTLFAAAWPLMCLLVARGRYEDAWDVIDDLVARAPRPRYRGYPWDGRPTFWDGGPPAPGRNRLALTSTDGLGDQLALVRYVPSIARQGWRVTFACKPALVRLLRSTPGVARLSVRGERGVPLCPDAWLPATLLPWRFRTAPATVPPPAPLRPDPEDVRRWSGRIAPVAALKVGLVWGSTDPRRSAPPAALAPLGTVPGVRFYGLQVGPHALRATDPPPVVAFEDLADGIRDVADLAAAMVHLDLVITVDTGPAHLAGSLGRPTWVLLPTHASWYWGLDGERTPWYPSARLFRQVTRGDWGNPIARVADELTILAMKRHYGALPLCGLRGVDEAGALTTWKPEAAAAARS